jgi:hypothetical protein
MTGVNLRYDLPTGQYTVRPREASFESWDICQIDGDKPSQLEPGKELTFTVLQP